MRLTRRRARSCTVAAALVAAAVTGTALAGQDGGGGERRPGPVPQAQAAPLPPLGDWPLRSDADGRAIEPAGMSAVESVLVATGRLGYQRRTLFAAVSKGVRVLAVALRDRDHPSTVDVIVVTDDGGWSVEADARSVPLSAPVLALEIRQGGRRRLLVLGPAAADRVQVATPTGYSAAQPLQFGAGIFDLSDRVVPRLRLLDAGTIVAESTFTQ